MAKQMKEKNIYWQPKFGFVVGIEHLQKISTGEFGTLPVAQNELSKMENKINGRRKKQIHEF